MGLLVAAASLLAVSTGVGAVIPGPPAFLFGVPLPSADAALCLPPYMLQDPGMTHVWWVKAPGGTDLTLTLFALTVNPAESGGVGARLFGPPPFDFLLGETFVAFAGPAGTETAAPPIVFGDAFAGIYRVEVFLVPGEMPARHYLLRVAGASMMGGSSPLPPQAESADARWTVNVRLGEPIGVSMIPGPEAGATAGTLSAYTPSGVFLGSVPFVAPFGAFLGMPSPEEGPHTIAVTGADGHYTLARFGGVDTGIYVSWRTSGFRAVTGSIASGGFPYLAPVTVTLTDPLTGAVFGSIDTASGLYAFDKVPAGGWLVTLAWDGEPGRLEARAAVTCERGAVVDFEIPRAGPIAVAGRDQSVPEGSLVTLSSAGSFDTRGGAITYAWTLLAFTGPPILLSDPTAPFPTFGAIDDARYDFRLTVTGFDGATASDDVTVRVLNVAPVADAGPPVAGFWGVPLAFHGSAFDPGVLDVAAGLTFDWDFGDGGTGSGPDPTHPYAVPGFFDVFVTVTDKDGGAGPDATTADVARRPTALDLTAPSSATNGSTVTISATLGDLVDPPSGDVAGLTILFDVGGTPVAATTDGAGTATILAPLGAGDLAVTADFAGDGRYLGSSDSTAVRNLGDVCTDGKVTGGDIRFASGGKGGFNVKCKDGLLKGEFQFQNRDTKLHAHEITSLVVSDDHRTARFTGVAKDGRTFEAYVEDNGKGRDDVLQVSIDGVAMNGDGDVLRGNIKIHVPRA